MPAYLVQVTRVETIAFEVEARDAENAVECYLADGDEVSSHTQSITVNSVECGSADEILG